MIGFFLQLLFKIVKLKCYYFYFYLQILYNKFIFFLVIINEWYLLKFNHFNSMLN